MVRRRRNIIRRTIQRIQQIVRRQPPPQPSPIPSSEIERRTLRQQAIDNIINQQPLADIETVTAGVRMMTINELRWSTRATGQQIALAARQDPDRFTVDMVPWNPWWYHPA